jgi:histidinol-phosphate aminotransferase
MLDFAVNVHATEPPSWLVERLASRLSDLSRYPSPVDERRATDTVAARHRRARDEVALLAGAAEGFALLANLRPNLAALIAPSFTEPEAALTAAGVAVQHVVLAPPYGLADADVPDDADLVVVGNPTNPTGVLHSREVKGIAVRRCDTFVGLDGQFLRAAVRPDWRVLVDAVAEVLR